ncbi:MAG: TonB-dependent receptor [Gemmatimonadota bacterium]
MTDLPRTAPSLALLALSAALLPVGSPASAQEAGITGTVTDAESGAALGSVEVRVESPDGSVAARRLTEPSGSWTIRGLEPGSYTVVFTLPGWETVTRRDVEIEPGATTRVSVSLAPRAFALNPLTVSAARQEEMLLDAPASVSVVDRAEVDRQPAITSLDYIEGMAGVDVIEAGLQGGYPISRGFNEIFSGSMLMLTDHRIARVPSLRANIPSLDPTSSVDVERIEVVRGPGSALYGPNAADGVVHKITRSPIDDPESVISVGGGVREQDAVGSALGPGTAFGPSEEGVLQVAGRAAHRFSEEFGFKITGEYLTGEDYFFQDATERENAGVADACLDAFSTANPACVTLSPGLGELPDPDELELIGDRDFGIERWSVDATAEWRPEEGTSAVFSYGRSQQVNAIDLTGIGASQARDFTLQYGQVRLDRDDFFAQAFVNWSDANDTFILRTGAPIDDQSMIAVGQVQHATDVSDDQRFVYGADYIHTNPVTNGSINGVHEDDDRTNEVGAYVQSETQLGERWELTLAARGDYHSVLDEVIFSPRSALVFRPAEEHSLRATYNRAYSTPDNNNLFLDIMAQRIPLADGISYGLTAQGTTDRGFTFRGGPGGRPMMKSPFTPPEMGGPGQFLPSRTSTAWQIATGIVASEDPALASLMAASPPSEQQVGVLLRQLNTGTGEFDLVERGFDAVRDVPPIQEEITNTVEVGYKGLVAERLQLAVDGYWTRVEDFIGPLAMETPNLFLDPEATVQYMVSELDLDPATAEEVVVGSEEEPGIGRIPLGVVTPEEVAAEGANMLLTYRNVGDVDLFGADVSAAYRLTDRWEAGLAMSVVDDDVFTTDEGERVELNASSFKAQGSLGYADDEAGFSGEVRYRFVDGYPAASGVFLGEVSDFDVVDVNLSYDIPGFRGLTLQLDVQNLLDEDYSTFPGAPRMGRFTMARARYTF